MVKTEQVQYTNISAPHIASPDKPVLISDQTYAKHMNRLQKMCIRDRCDRVDPVEAMMRWRSLYLEFPIGVYPAAIFLQTLLYWDFL